jgi:predicted ATPase
MPRTTNNLSPQATPLIGRERDLARLQQHLLREDVRLITLTGPDGTGKTRLAIACAQRMLQHFYDSVYFVDLAPLRHARFVLSTIARTLQVQMSSSSPSDALLRFLHGKCILLVLDNFEHVQAAAPELSALLSGCSDVKVLATSRAPLHLRWEHEVPIPPLPLPDLLRANLGRMSWKQGDLAAAQDLAEQSLATARAHGSPWLISHASSSWARQS